MLEMIICVVAVVFAGWAIAKNYDAKVVLFATGLVLLAIAVMLGHPAVSATATSGQNWVDPFTANKDL